MNKLPDSLAIAMWIVGACWALAILGYALGESVDWVFLLLMFGFLTGAAEWYVRRNLK
jgi:hypothetical protein